MTATKIMLAAALVAVFVASGCGGKKDSQAGKTEEKQQNAKAGGEKQGEEKHGEEKNRVRLSPEALKNTGIKTVPATAQALTDTIAVTATISHNQDRLFHITPRITGRVVDVRASIGGPVKTGTVLAVLDSTELG